MRAVLFAAVLGFLVGCGSSAPTTAPETKPVEQIKKPDPPKVEPKPDEKLDPKEDTLPVVEVKWDELIKAYHDNPVAADAKYRWKRLAVKTAANVIGKTQDGEVYVGKRYTDSPSALPSIVFAFAKTDEDDVAKLKRDMLVTITGVCRGRTDDGIARAFGDFRFFVRLENCRVSDFANWSAPKK